MRQFGVIKNKLRLIYTSPLVYLMIFLQVSFLVIYMYTGKTDAAFHYFSILEKDLFMWMICIPILVVQHKVSIFSTYYSWIGRIRNKRRMMFIDCITLAVSTVISTCIVLFVPLIFFYLKEKLLISQEMTVTLLFLLTRYILLELFIQYIIYAIMYAFSNLQKRGGSICVLPFLFYFVFTSPMELLRIKGLYMPILDFSAGGNYVFAMDGVAIWGSIFSYNIHLVGYLVLVIWITLFIAKRWEFLENESVYTL